MYKPFKPTAMHNTPVSSKRYGKKKKHPELYVQKCINYKYNIKEIKKYISDFLWQTMIIVYRVDFQTNKYKWVQSV